jgi:ankyrin repeat protein
MLHTTAISAVVFTYKHIRLSIRCDAHFMQLVACRSGHESIAKYLLRHGSITTDITDQGHTALHLACEYGSPGLITALLDRKVNYYC